MHDRFFRYSLVGIGCCLGGGVRFCSEFLVGPMYGTPFAVLCVNVVGCFLIGLLAGFLHKEHIGPHMGAFTITGFCGGLTTFSSFANSILALFLAGDIAIGLLYVLANMLFCLVSVASGLYLVLGKEVETLV